MSEPVLTDAMSREAMPRAEKAVCRPADQRNCAFPYDAETALAERTSSGRCLIGWVAADRARQDWDAWDTVHTSEGRLRRHTD